MLTSCKEVTQSEKSVVGKDGNDVANLDGRSEGKKMTFNTTAIRAKAQAVQRITSGRGGGPSSTEPFVASKGWFGKYKKWQSLYITKLKVEGPNDVQSTTSDCSVEVKTECLLQIEQEEVQKVVMPVDKLTTRLARFFTLADRLAQETMDMDPNLERSLHFGRNLSSALAVYKDIYREEQKNIKTFHLNSVSEGPQICCHTNNCTVTFRHYC